MDRIGRKSDDSARGFLANHRCSRNANASQRHANDRKSYHSVRGFLTIYRCSRNANGPQRNATQTTAKVIIPLKTYLQFTVAVTM